MKTNWLANPYYLYALAFGLVLWVYGWGWTTLYPALTVPVVGFWLTGVGLMAGLGWWVQPRLGYQPIAISPLNGWAIALITAGYMAEFTYNRGIPLVLILAGADYDYMTFGIPTFHVFLQTFAPFYTVYWFHQWLSNRGGWRLAGFGWLLLLNVCVVNRGSTLMILAACLIIFLQERGQVSRRQLLGLLVGMIGFFYLFGALGYSRSSAGQKEPFYDLTQTTDAFRTGWVPGEYLWFYLYVSSPLSNFQNVVDQAHDIRYNVPGFVGDQLLPDFIYKRFVDPVADPDFLEADRYLVVVFLNASSTYYSAYRRMGWPGTVILLLALATLMMVVLRGVGSNSPYRQTTIALLGCMAIFSTFDNMIRFTGASFQLVYPVLLTLLHRYRLIIGWRIRLGWPQVRLAISTTGLHIRWRRQSDDS